MYLKIVEIIDNLRHSLLSLEMLDVFFVSVLAVNFILGIISLILSIKSHSKLIKGLSRAVFSEERYEGNPAIELLQPKFNALHVFVAFFFCVTLLISPDGTLTVPVLGLFIFETCNLVSKFILKRRFKKAKVLCKEYSQRDTTSVIEKNQEEETFPIVPPTAETAKVTSVPVEPKHVGSSPVSPVIVVKPTPTAGSPTAAETEILLPEQKTEPQQATKYQPFEPRHAESGTIPVPPSPTPVPPASPPPAASTAERETLVGYTVDGIVARINQIKQEGATRQTMTELIYIIQKEREKNENKNPIERQRLSEALSDLLKTMNKTPE